MDRHDENGYAVDDANVNREIITDLVNGIPAVDAIPVEWLEARIKYAKETGIWEAQEAFEFVLMCWKGAE